MEVFIVRKESIQKSSTITRTRIRELLISQVAKLSPKKKLFTSKRKYHLK
jgi:hypothetical protein